MEQLEATLLGWAKLAAWQRLGQVPNWASGRLAKWLPAWQRGKKNRRQIERGVHASSLTNCVCNLKVPHTNRQSMQQRVDE